jgi:hypothetical protein
MDFEAAAALHKQWEKVRAAAQLADELVRPLNQLRAVILQEAAPQADESHPDAAVFLFAHGQLTGPEHLSTLGIRAVREQTAVGSSLFAQPLMLSPVPLETPPNAVILSAARSAESKDPEGAQTTQTPEDFSATTPEDRARTILSHLSAQTETTPDIAEFCDHLSLLRRWYYRPEKQRTGEVFLPNPAATDPADAWPIRRILNGAARIVLGPPTLAAPVDREAAKTLKTKIIHAGREGIEREVPILPKRRRTRKAITPTDVAE